MSSSTAFVALGANIDAPEARVRECIDLLDATSFGRVVARSSLYRSAPVGRLDQPDFVNAAVALETPLAPLGLMQALLALEARLGRVRDVRNGPRRIDLDLIIFGHRSINLPELVLPHPRAAERAFVLQPLHEIAADLVLPGYGAVAQLLALLPRSDIHRIAA